MFGSIRQFVSTRRNVTLADQALVSGSNFLTGILLVRALGLVAFGRFTVAYAVLLLANGLQLSFIASPMITLGALCDSDQGRRRFVRGMYGVQCVFCGAIAVFALLGTSGYLHLRRDAFAGGLLLPFTAAIAAFLMQDWLRRYYFTIGKGAAALCNDILSYAGQVVVLAGLWSVHRITINSALWCIAITSGLAFGLGAISERLGWTRAEAADAWRRTRSFSIDLGLSNQFQWAVYQGAMLAGAAMVGAQAAGSVRATQNIVGPVNVAYQAMENLVPLKAAEEMRRGGFERASKFLWRFGVKGFIGLALFFSLAALFASQFLAFFYGHALRGYAAVLDLQMLYFLLAWPLRQLSFLFRTATHTRPVLYGSMIAAIVSLGAVVPCVRAFGTTGIMLAALAGQFVNLLYLGWAWGHLKADLIEAAA